MFWLYLFNYCVFDSTLTQLGTALYMLNICMELIHERHRHTSQKKKRRIVNGGSDFLQNSSFALEVTSEAAAGNADKGQEEEEV